LLSVISSSQDQSNYDTYEQRAPEQKSSTKKKKTALIAAAIVLVVGIGGFFGIYAIVEAMNSNTYAEDTELMNQGVYDQAQEKFSALRDYEDSEALAEFCSKAHQFTYGEDLLENKDYQEAQKVFAELDTFMDADVYVKECDGWLAFEEAKKLSGEGKYDEAETVSNSFQAISAVKSAKEVIEWQKSNVNRPDFTGGSKFEKMEPLWKTKTTNQSVTPKKSATKRFGWSMSTKASILRSGLVSFRLQKSSV
jgi:hypothetical protein